MSDVVVFDLEKAGQRKCGSCSLCCKLLPVRSLAKPANTKCKHQRFSASGKCCKVYSHLQRVSPECRIWSCRWLLSQAGDISRPDRSHLVIDPMPDFVLIDEGQGEGHKRQPIIQVWLDPAHPEAHRDPAFRAWLDQRKSIALVRYRPHAFVLFPPSRSTDGQWHEHRSDLQPQGTHSPHEIMAAIAEAGEA